MIVDASAVIAVLRAEPDAPRYAEALVTATHPRMSAATFLEAAIVVDVARDPVASRRFDELVSVAGIEVVPGTVEQAAIAREAYRDFGRGAGTLPG